MSFVTLQLAVRATALNGKSNSSNLCTSLHETISVCTFDYDDSVARELAAQSLARGTPTQSPVFGTEDMRAAYRQIPSRNPEQNLVCVWCLKERTPALDGQQYLASASGTKERSTSLTDAPSFSFKQLAFSWPYRASNILMTSMCLRSRRQRQPPNKETTRPRGRSSLSSRRLASPLSPPSPWCPHTAVSASELKVTPPGSTPPLPLALPLP